MIISSDGRVYIGITVQLPVAWIISFAEGESTFVEYAEEGELPAPPAQDGQEG